jgi:hypothetical protein
MRLTHGYDPTQLEVYLFYIVRLSSETRIYFGITVTVPKFPKSLTTFGSGFWEHRTCLEILPIPDQFHGCRSKRGEPWGLLRAKFGSGIR